MNKFIKITQNYLLYALPFVLVCAGWSAVKTEKEVLSEATIASRILWEILSWNLITWFVVLILFLVMLVVFPLAREKTLKRLANLKERDEREQYITGKAARTAYIATLSLLILLLFFSVFSLNIYHKPEAQAINGKTGTIAIGMQFKFLDSPAVVSEQKTEKVIFESRDIPLSKSAILLLLIIWQLGAFNYSARKENSF